ncbi:Ig-like domain-containing protein [Bradyrhizobium betae]
MVSTSEYLASLEFGAEIGSGAGTLAIHSLDLTVAKNPSSSSDAAPLAPTITASSPDSAGLASGLTNVNHVTLIGTAQVGTTVQIFDGTRQIGTAVVGGSGTWSFATAALADGTHALTAKVVNGAGGVSAASSAINLIVDTTPPNVPAIIAFSPNSNVSHEGSTNANHVTLNGTAEAGSNVRIFDGSAQVGTLTASASGVWSFTTGLLTDGTHSFTSAAMDAAGNVSALSAPLNAVVDTIVPSAPVIKSFSPDSDTTGDGITNVNQIILTGTAEAGSSVQVFDGSTQVGAATANASGAWSFATAKLANGSHNFAAKAVDAATNTSALSTVLEVVVDTIAPAAPVVVSDTAATGTSMNVSGTAEAGALVRLYEGAKLLGTSTAALNGTWTINSGNLSAGAHAFSSTATDAAGNVSALSNILDPIIGTAIESAGTTTLMQAGNNYYLSGIGADVLLKYSGAAVQSGQFDNFAPVAAEQISTGYEVAWKNAVTNQYSVWSTDANGSYTGNLYMPGPGTSADFQRLETSFHQDLNGDGKIGVVQSASSSVIEAIGATTLAVSGSNYLLNSVNGGTGPTLKYQGAVVTIGQFDGYTSIGVEAIPNGYEVAWKNASTGNYSVWSTDANGNYTGNLYMPGSGTSAAFQTLETSFQQDLNGDGKIGAGQSASSSVIEAIGATALAVSGSNYLLNSVNGGTGPTLKYQGAVVTIGQFDGYASIGVEAIPNGYEVAWKNASTGNYSVWSTDANGNYTGNLYMPGSGTSAAFQTLETSFQQDLNGDGKIGAGQSASSSVIEAIGATALAVSGSNYLLNSVNGGTGPTLKYQGAAVAIGQFDDYTPIGVEAVSNGYEVAWKNTTTGNYSVWSTDTSGNYTGNFYMPGSGTDGAFKALETSFQQDLNGDGVINSISTVIDVVGKATLNLAKMIQEVIIESGASVEITGAASGSFTFKAVTGTLVLDHASQFTGKIFGLSGNGDENASDLLDLKDISYGSGTTMSYSGDHSGGMLTVKDAQNHTANIALVGDYTHSTFNLLSDGGGGTLVIDPPVDQFQFARPAVMTPLAGAVVGHPSDSLSVFQAGGPQELYEGAVGPFDFSAYVVAQTQIGFVNSAHALQNHTEILDVMRMAQDHKIWTDGVLLHA